MTDNRTTELLDGLRNVGNLHEFAELFGFDWRDDSDWTWHDVAVKMADELEQAIAATLGSGTSEALKPCIFCKSDKKLRLMAKHYTDESHIWWVECARCGACGMHSHEYERAVESWNAAWDTCAERTCRPTEPERFLDGTDCPAWLCSECGELFELGTNFFSNCGAKVVSE